MTTKKTAQDRRMDEVLTRMLNTPPMPHVAPAKLGKKAEVKKKPWSQDRLFPSRG